MRNLILFLLLSTSYILNAQIKGEIKETTSQLPIEGSVIQYGDNQQDYVTTDKDGQFLIPSKHNSIFHIQCLGFKRVSILASSLLDNPNINLEEAPIELNEVVISPIDAEALLKKVFEKTRERLLTHQYLNYNVDFSQTTEDNKVQSFQMHYSSYLKKTEGWKIPYELNLVDAQVQNEDSISARIIGFEYHPSQILNTRRLKDYNVKVSNSDDDSLIILRAEKKKGTNNTYLFHINSSDSTLRLMDCVFPDLSFMKERFMGWRLKAGIKNQTAQIEFKPFQDKLYMSVMKLNSVYHHRDISKKTEYDVAYFIETKFTGFRKDKPSDVKLNGYSGQIFKRFADKKAK